MPTNEQLQQEINALKQQIKDLTDVYYRTHSIDNDTFFNPVYINNGLYLKDGGVFSVGSNLGGKIGKTGEKIGFLGHAPIARQSAINTPSGGAVIDAESRTAIGLIINVLKNFGFTA